MVLCAHAYILQPPQSLLLTRTVTMPITSQDEKKAKGLRGFSTSIEKVETSTHEPEDVFGDETGHDIQYKTLSWQVSLSISLLDTFC